MTMMRTKIISLAACVAALPLTACAGDDYGPGYYAPPPPSGPPAGYYAPPPPPAPAPGDYAPPPPPPANYAPEREYREQPGYDRQLRREDRVYRGQDGRYYCRRSDGTTGTVVGAVAGGALGAILGGGGALGTIIGAGGGALLGRSIDRGEVHCR